MAKQKADREDLILEGTAMPIRGRMWIGGNEVVLGFRAAGAGSLYWNQDPVFQFDTESRLRRIFFDSERYKSRDGRLFRLVQPTPDETKSVSRLQLVEQPVSGKEERRILQRASDCLQQIERHFAATEEPSSQTPPIEVVGESADEFRRLVLQWLGRLPRPLQFAEQPSA
jgi:hypothetical protein